MAAPATGRFAESRTVTVRSAPWPSIKAAGPSNSTLLPVTATVPLPLRAPTLAVTVMLRLPLAPPVPSSARAWPFLSVTASTLPRMPESAAKEIFAFGKARLAPSLTRAVTATSLPARPAEASSVLENTRLTALARLAGSGGVTGGITGGVTGGVTGGTRGGGGLPPQPAVLCSEQPAPAWLSVLPPPPQPAREARRAASNVAGSTAAGRRCRGAWGTMGLRELAELLGVNPKSSLCTPSLLDAKQACCLGRAGSIFLVQWRAF